MDTHIFSLILTKTNIQNRIKDKMSEEMFTANIWNFILNTMI